MIAAVPWLCLGVYLLGWLVSIPALLRRYMERTVCTGCQQATCICYAYGHVGERSRLPLGSVHERDGTDVAMIAFVSLFWPARLVWHACAAVASVLGRGVMAAVAIAAPLTAPEIERRQREQAERIATQQSEIERLSKQLAEKGDRDVR